MTWLYPLGLLALLAIPAILILHALRPRFRPLPVSSLLLWPRPESSPRSHRRWQRPRRTLLLLLQLLLAALFALALIGPATETARGRHLVLVIDGSSAMAARDVGPSRLAVARTAAEQRLNTLGPADTATVILAGPQPAALAWAGDPAAARAGLTGGLPADPPPPDAGGADLTAAFELARAAFLAAPARANDLVLLTGSRVDPALVSGLAGEVEIETIGEGGPNLGLVAFAARRPAGWAAATGLARIANYGDQAATADLTIVADGAPIERKSLRIGPRAEQSVEFSLPAGARAIEGRLAPTGAASADVLPADDRAGGAVDGAQRQVTVVARDGDPAVRALSVLPGVTVRVVAPEQYATPPVGADRSPVTVFSGWLPETPPAGPALIIAPPPGVAWLPAGNPAPGELVRQDSASPLLRGLDLTGVSFGPVRSLTLPDWAAPAATGATGPLIYHGVLENQRVAVLAFTPDRSNLPKLPAFPLLLANTLEWLDPAPAPSGAPGDAERRLASGAAAASRPSVPNPAALVAAAFPEPGRILDATWWRWLVLAGFVLATAEWWRYTREAR